MQNSFVSALRAGAVSILALMLPAAGMAQSVEAPPSYNAAQIPGITRVGANYSIRNPVHSDGLFRVYVLTTPYGEVHVRGDDMLRMRINELFALSLMEKVSNSGAFGKALVQAGINPVKYTGRLITNPIGTVRDTLSGVGAMFARIGSDINNAGKTQDNAVESILGVTSERRELAAAYGVDPYTDFPPLDGKLKQLSEAAALGGLAVTGALLAVPGAAGIVMSNLSTANKLNDVAIEDLARKYTASQILDLNRARLATMGVQPELSARLLANRNFTPIDLAAMIAALDSMAAVKDRSVFVARAAAADERFIAYFVRRQAEFLADDYRRHGGYVRFVNLAGYPFAIRRDGHAVLLAPIDSLSWTSQTASGFGEVTAARIRIAPKSRGDIRITGQATALAKQRLKSQGWELRENQRP